MLLKLVYGFTKTCQTNTNPIVRFCPRKHKSGFSGWVLYCCGKAAHVGLPRAKSAEEVMGKEAELPKNGLTLKTACTCVTPLTTFSLPSTIFPLKISEEFSGNSCHFFPCTMKACDKMLARCQQCAADMWQTIILFILFQMDFKPKVNIEKLVINVCFHETLFGWVLGQNNVKSPSQG